MQYTDWIFVPFLVFPVLCLTAHKDPIARKLRLRNRRRDSDDSASADSVLKVSIRGYYVSSIGASCSDCQVLLGEVTQANLVY